MSEDDDRFADEERITKNLRLGSNSVPAANRTLLGILAFLPPGWRGPVICLGMVIVGYLIGSNTPNIINWLKVSLAGNP